MASVGVEDLDDAVANPAMPDTGALALFSHDVLLGEQSQEVRRARLAEAEMFLDVSNGENRVCEEQVHNLWATAPATSKPGPIALPQIRQEFGAIDCVRGLDGHTVEEETQPFGDLSTLSEILKAV